jgi:hypothetical protein
MSTYNHQIAIELLREYFKKTPREKIKADWDAVKNLGYEGPTVNQFLSELKMEAFQFDKAMFAWEQSLLIKVGQDVNYSTDEMNNSSQTSTNSKKPLNEEACNYNYAMAA